MSSETDLARNNQVLKEVLLASITEQRRQRRWKIFFKLIYLGIFLSILSLIFSGGKSTPSIDKKPHVGLIKLEGELMDKGDANANDINKGLNAAFRDPHTKAILLEINSPGGSPVQADEIYSNLRRLENEHPKIPVYAVCTEACASGAYYVAAGATQIYADQASLVGSIGVLMDGFGFVDTLQKLGVQRRLMTSGSEKGFLDPFSPQKPEDQAYMQTMLDMIHQQFIDAVKSGRGNRLHENPLLFSGLVWTGQQALGLGLVDGIATPDQVLRTVIKNNHVVDFTVQNNLLSQLTTQFGTKMSHIFLADLSHQNTRIH